MNNILISLGNKIDYYISKTYLKLLKEKNALLSFNFHGIFQNEKEKKLNIVDPQLFTTLENFEIFIKYF